MNKILCLLAGITMISSIYDFSINDINGNNISLTQFRGKKILFVNTASASQYTSQYGSLEQLYQKYRDSLVVIAIPSNTFGNDTGTNAEIKNFITGTYHTHFIIAEKSSVMGDNQLPLYNWLTHASQNGMMENTINGDFYKFLVDSSGTLIGAFSPDTDPLSNAVQNAITNN